MANPAGQQLLQCVAERILALHLERQGMDDVTIVYPWPSSGARRGVDITHRFAGRAVKIKVKPDPYFGRDSGKGRDRELGFYRPEGDSYAFEAISNAATREPGWIFNSEADELHYYLLAISQPEEEVAALMHEPDGIFLAELAVERDELHVLPMRPVREWFEANYEHYTPRPVMQGGHSAWFRLVPREVLEKAVPGRRVTSAVFSRLSR